MHLTSCRWSRNSCRRLSRRTCFSGWPACRTACFSTAPYATRRWGDTRSWRPIRSISCEFRRTAAMPWRVWPNGWAGSTPRPLPEPAAVPGRGRRTVGLRPRTQLWRVCRRPRPTSLACRPWPWGSTTWLWRSITLPTGRGSSRKGCQRANRRVGANGPRSGLPRLAVGLRRRHWPILRRGVASANKRWAENMGPSPSATREGLSLSQSVPQYPAGDIPGVTSNFSKPGYLGPSSGRSTTSTPATCFR